MGQSMNDVIDNWTELSEDEKKVKLYLKQKNMLEIFLEKNAISKEQFDKSLGDLTEKMGMQGKVK